MSTERRPGGWWQRAGRGIARLAVGDLPDPEPGPGEVRIRISASGINPGDVGKRMGLPGAPMPFPRVIPHSDGAGVIDAAGDGVDQQRVGQQVWCYGAQSYRAFGTAAEYCVVPEPLGAWSGARLGVLVRRRRAGRRIRCAGHVLGRAAGLPAVGACSHGCRARCWQPSWPAGSGRPGRATQARRCR